MDKRRISHPWQLFHHFDRGTRTVRSPELVWFWTEDSWRITRAFPAFPWRERHQQWLRPILTWILQRSTPPRSLWRWKFCCSLSSTLSSWWRMCRHLRPLHRFKTSRRLQVRLDMPGILSRTFSTHRFSRTTFLATRRDPMDFW